MTQATSALEKLELYARICRRTVPASVRKTNRVVAVEEGPLTGGRAGEVLAWRIATPNAPIPYSPPLEDAFLPGADRLRAGIRQRLR